MIRATLFFAASFILTVLAITTAGESNNTATTVLAEYEQLVKLGSEHLSKRQFEEAAGNMRKALKIKNSDPGPYLHLAAAEMQMNHVDKALNVFKAAAKLFPSHPQLFYRYCHAVQAALQNPTQVRPSKMPSREKAVKICQKGDQLNPRDTFMLKRLALVSVLANQDSDAILTCEKWIKIFGKKPEMEADAADVRLNLMELYTKVGRLDDYQRLTKEKVSETGTGMHNEL